VTTFIVATRNVHKTAEIRQILGGAFRVRDLGEFPDAPEVVEDADTFAGNARKKAESLARWLREKPLDGEYSVVADDSGLEVDALGGAPGVHSARFAALETGRHGNSSDSDNNAKLLRLLRVIAPDKRTARFRCVLALVSSRDGKAVCFEGACEGSIADAPSGSGGFGYDPLFVPAGHDRSLADLGEDVKNKLSHRAKALEKLRLNLQGEFDSGGACQST
jgi:XTP/dITP diphosphohydrolase